MIKLDSSEPLVMAHAGGRAHGRENTASTVQEALRHSPGIIELDLRRSNDGQLYCYHGFPAIVVAMFITWVFLTLTVASKVLKRQALTLSSSFLGSVTLIISNR